MNFEEDNILTSRRGVALDWLYWRAFQVANKLFKDRFAKDALIHSALFREWQRGTSTARTEIRLIDRRSHSEVLLRRASFGEKHPSKTFLLIRRNNSTAGFFSHFITNIGWIRFAFDNGYIPVIDMIHSNNIYATRASRKKKLNVWELFFEQPSPFSVADVLEAQNVLIAERDPPREIRPNDSMDFLTNHISDWRDVINISAKPTRQLKTYVETLSQKIFFPDKNVLGVLLRGTDYTTIKPPQHPIMPTWDKVALDIKHILEAKKFDRIFLATEDLDIASHLRNEFGNKLITAQDQIKYSGHGFLSQSHGVSGNLNRAESYIANMILLSKCKFVLAARTSGAVGAALMAQDTSNWKFYDLGVY